jgi:hypothetical protein
MTAATSLHRDLDEVLGCVLLAQRALADGGLVDLAGMEERVSALCAAMRHIPRSDATPFEPRLVGLIEELGHLAAALDAARERTAADLGEAGSRRLAAEAYGKPRG